MTQWALTALLAVLASKAVYATEPVDRVRTCFNQAGKQYQQSPLLLWAIAKEESGLRASAINRNTNGTTDIGVMQINSVWLPTLAKYGISREDLFDPCVNIFVGAWVKAQCVQRFGYTWQALSCYNTGHPTRGRQYAARVLGTAYKAYQGGGVR